MILSILEIFRISMSIRTILHDKRTRIYETDMFFGEKACLNCFKHAQKIFFSSAHKVSGYGGGKGTQFPFPYSPSIKSSTIFAQRSMLSAAMCSYGPWKAKPPVQRFGVGRPM